MENNKKWYVFANCGVGTQLFMCDLTQEEFETIKRLIDSTDIDNGNVIFEEDFSGWITEFDGEGYDSKEAALKAMQKYNIIGSNKILLKP